MSKRPGTITYICGPNEDFVEITCEDGLRRFSTYDFIELCLKRATGVEFQEVREGWDAAIVHE